MTNVLHILDHSLPEHDGYSFRSHSICTELMSSGVDVKVITGPKQGMGAATEHVADGIRYIRTAIEEGVGTSGVAGQLRTVRLTRNRVADYLRLHATDIVHAHSPCLNGLAVLGQGRPLVYEMRSSWEDAAVSVGTTQEGSIRYRLSKSLETYVANRADAVVVICDGLKADLIGRGVSADKITVVPNALSEDMLVRPDADKIAAVRERHALSGYRVIGFFGSFFEWEGVDKLIKALPAVLESAPKTRLLIAGGGRQESILRDLVASMGLADSVIFAGRIEHDEISAYYAAVDVMAYPRIRDRLTDMVTPLKPLEAMAQGTAVVASDVGGHRELVADGDTGFLFKAGSGDDIAQKIVSVFNHPDEARDVTARALQHVNREKRWSAVVQRYLPVYERLLDRNRA